MISSQHITVAAAIKGSRQPLMDFVRTTGNRSRYKIVDIKYDTKEDVHRVVFKIETDILTQLSALTELCCNDLKINRGDLYNFRIKKPKIVFGRSIVIFILRYRFGLPSTQIGRLLGCNHATVILTCRKFKKSRPDIIEIKNAPLEDAYKAVKRCKVGGYYNV